MAQYRSPLKASAETNVPIGDSKAELIISEGSNDENLLTPLKLSFEKLFSFGSITSPAITASASLAKFIMIEFALFVRTSPIASSATSIKG